MDHPYITSAKELGAWGQKMLTFGIIYADLGWLGGLEKVQKCADIIQGQSFKYNTSKLSELYLAHLPIKNGTFTNLKMF